MLMNEKEKKKKAERSLRRPISNEKIGGTSINAGSSANQYSLGRTDYCKKCGCVSVLSA